MLVSRKAHLHVLENPAALCGLSPVEDEDGDDKENEDAGADGSADQHRLRQLALAAQAVAQPADTVLQVLADQNNHLWNFVIVFDSVDEGGRLLLWRFAGQLILGQAGHVAKLGANPHFHVGLLAGAVQVLAVQGQVVALVIPKRRINEIIV